VVKKNKLQIPVYTIYSKNRVFFRHKNKWLLFDLNGKQIGDQYDGVFIDNHNIIGNLVGVSIKNKLGIIDKGGETLVKPIYDQIYCLKEDGSIVVRINNRWSWLDIKGKAIYENFDDFKYVLENYLFLLKNGVWYYVSNKGKEFRN
jgi:hypothetical protein